MTDPLDDMPLVGHLVELRRRVVRVLVALVVVFVALLPLANTLYAGISAPLRELLPDGSQMIATDVTSPLLTPFTLTFYVALFLCMPYLLLQLWGFIAPGLYDREKRLATPLLLSSIVLFYCGMAFAFYVVLPLILGFFTTVGPTEVAMMTDIKLYLSFVMKLLIVFGITFEIPVAILILVAAGVVTPQSLADKRRYIMVGCMTVAMFLTPPDVLSMLMLGIPMILLFELGLLGSRFIAAAPSKTEET